MDAKRPDPHDFSQSREAWEESVFINARYFALNLRRGVGDYARMELATFAEVEAQLAIEPEPD
jgi:hypothetical protein